MLRRGPHQLLTDINLTIHGGQRVGIVGRNGTGKTSLFALLLGELGADAGEVHVPAGLTIATVRQSTPSGNQSALDFVLDGDAELRRVQAALAEAEAAADGLAQAELHARMAAIDGYAAHARAARLLHGLGFAPDRHLAPIDSFSGGWRMRLNLAAALMCRSDLLLLDEPTNHLDMDAVLWLQGFLASYGGTLLVISHDRDFLDAVTNHILHLAQGRATLYPGNYSAFEKLRAEQALQQQAAHEAQQKRIAEMQQFIDRFRAKATKARQAQSRIKQIERMQTVAAAHWDTPFHFQFLAPERLPETLLRLDQTAVGYDDQALLSALKLRLAPGDRLAILGRNGAGKSTLMKLLAGVLQPLAGEMQRHRYLRVGYFAQHQLEQLDGQASPLTHLQRLAPQAGEQELRDFLGGFAFRGERALEPVAPFSGGEKARLALAQVVYRRPNLLLLDEPTNHLDLDMRHALEQALQDYSGAVVLIAHDRHLIDATCDQLWRVADGALEPFAGDMDDYARWLQRQNANIEGATHTRPKAAGGQPRQQDAQRDKHLRRQLAKAEQQLTHLEQQLAAIDADLSKPSVYGNPSASARLGQERARLQQRLEATETEWLQHAAALEEQHA
ncbi:MAG TPA: ATP-binding cassette domain-containing protein [Salinisphaeraceae bacterium]|nr:ATP-binding cassette domain-containing protein [Salinisphaeraceae bacterium]